MTNWLQRIDGWRAITDIKSFPPASAEALQNVLQSVPEFPDILESFLRSTNGLIIGYSKILPVEETKDIKRTWDSIQRANDPKTSRFLGRSPQLLERFVIFADVGVGRAAAIDRADGSIWYEEEGKLRQTDLNLEDFIDTLVREVAS